MNSVACGDASLLRSSNWTDSIMPGMLTSHAIAAFKKTTIREMSVAKFCILQKQVCSA
jgi:hypothetical protein